MLPVVLLFHLKSLFIETNSSFCGISDLVQTLHSRIRNSCSFSLYGTRAAKAAADALFPASGCSGQGRDTAEHLGVVSVSRWEHMGKNHVVITGLVVLNAPVPGVIESCKKFSSNY